MRAISLSLLRLPRIQLVFRIGASLALRRQRQRLALLDKSQLLDIGLTADAAIAESRRPIWDAPPHWWL